MCSIPQLNYNHGLRPWNLNDSNFIGISSHNVTLHSGYDTFKDGNGRLIGYFNTLLCKLVIGVIHY